MAAEYDLEQDSLLSERKNSMLMYMEKEKVHAYLKDLKEFRQEQHEWQIYYQRLPEVRSLEDLFALQDSLPALRKLMANNDEASFIAKRQRLLAEKCHIYLIDGKVISFVSPLDKSDKRHPGVRLDR